MTEHQYVYQYVYHYVYHYVYQYVKEPKPLCLGTMPNTP